ncbi:MAG: hypothetical protein KME10_16280 [Plectolyngbya sp. WJT66-NPBG17]|jgi:hypothetical protein|nr:hypothetical protein [Plectolyngbya sp. WJT66-NPBG17]MBW4527327.1 hypothetical protein [Phormidium tanganyikae FI6-MK23]
MKMKFTAQDLSMLEDFRTDRLQQLYAHALSGCSLELKFDALLIHCSEPWCVDQVIEELDLIGKAALIVLGVKSVSVCYASEEVCRIKTRSNPQPCVSR